MKITISSVGSRGDVQPYIALGKGLAAAGHQVTLAVDPLFQSFVEEHGLTFARLNADPIKALETDIRKVGSNPFKLFRWMADIVEEMGNTYFESYLEANRSADLMIFSNVAAMVGVHVGAALDIPMISSALQPIVPTKAYSYSAGMHVPEWMPFRGFFNKLTYKITYRFLYRMFFEMTNQGREEVLGLPPLPWRMYANLNLSYYPILHGFSRHVVPFPPDYDDFQIFTGYWFLEQDETYSPPETLSRFLAEEPRPLYVGFGSMVDKEAEALTELVVEALALADQRAVLLGGWTDLGGSGLPESILKVDSVPHDWLFPQVAATVIHGGAGTTAASLQAGTPTVVVPYFADQPFWGRRVAKLSAGPQPVPRQKLTAKRLAAAITQAVEDKSIRQQAAQVGKKLRNEDGVANAVQAVEKLLATRMDRMMAEERLKTGKM